MWVWLYLILLIGLSFIVFGTRILSSTSITTATKNPKKYSVIIRIDTLPNLKLS
jgi:hypothetical protein